MDHQPSGVPIALGELLRRYRGSAGLSQEALAERAAVSARSILYVERGMRRPHPATLRRLADALSLTAQERETLMRAGRQGSTAARQANEPPAERRTAERRVSGQTATPSSAPVHNLPASLSSFIGREHAQATVRDLLTSHRLVTLIGAGGVGKTRLALAVAEGITGDYPDGVWLVELAALTDPELAPEMVAQALGLREEPNRSALETLCAHCREKRMLLVLDNCEHIVTVCAPRVGTLLRAAPQLRILATSREPLRVAGEQCYRVPSLSVPDPRRLPAGDLAGAYEAVRLFVQRAQEQRSDFVLDGRNVRAVVEVCSRLDGIPLAIELAAARVGGMGVEAIAARLDDRFRLLTSGARDALPRQQTLQATLDWSYDLLGGSERTMLQRLAVFAGGWTLEAAAAVCAGEGIEEWEVPTPLGRLVGKSLVQVDETGEGEVRYRLLETVRQYAAERLGERGEGAAVRARHLTWCLTLAEAAAPRLTGPEQRAWLDRLETEHENLRAGLAWALERGAGEVGLRLAGALWRFWWLRSYLGEGRQWLGRLLGREAEQRTRSRAWALLGIGWLTCRQGEKDLAAEYLAQSLALFRALGDRHGEAEALARAGAVEWERGEYESARMQGDAALAFSRQLGDPEAIALALHHRGDAAYKLGDLQGAQALYSESLAIRRTLGDPGGMSQMLNNLGHLCAGGGSYEEAATLLGESLALAQQTGHRGTVAYAEMNLGEICCSLGEHDRARRLLDDALGLFRGMGDRANTAEVLRKLGSLAMARGDYPEAGARLSQALALARELGDRPSAAQCQLGRALLARKLMDLAQARALYAESLGHFHAMHDRYLMAWALHGLALVTAAQGRSYLAARLLGTVDATLAALGAALEPQLRDEESLQCAALRAALGETTFALAWAEGQAMTLDESIASALKTEPVG